MTHSSQEFQRVIARHAKLWKKLREKSVVVTASRWGEGAFHRGQDLAAEAQRLAEAHAGPRVLEELCEELERKSPAHPCVIDMVQAVTLVKEQRLDPPDAISRARVRYQGTDGVRGKVARDDPAERPLAALVREGQFTPGVCELLCAGVVLSRKARKPPTVVVAEDGRDPFGNRDYPKAAIRGFTRFGCKVFDLGIAPTPLAPVAAAKLRAEVAAVLTASHNPADQNGIKFFIDGRKPLPETGDCPISAAVFLAALEGLPRERPHAHVERVDPKELLREYLACALAAEEIEVLRGAILIIDVAHGAFAPLAREETAALGLRAEVMSEDMTGDNINRESGVAWIEGKQRIAGADADGEIAIVGKVRSVARESRQPVFGIALDGDGDRGLVLVYDAQTDEVRVIDGDRIAFLLARLAHRTGKTKGRVFAGTVESDLAVFDAVRRLGIETVITPVGDKWLSARSELAAKLLVGEEPSGHLVFPVDLPVSARRKKTIFTGNGLVTGLRGAAAILGLGLKPAEAAQPFRPGVVRTFYTYFVDRARFHRESAVWRKDVEIARKELDALKSKGEMPGVSELRPVDFEDDPDMLYLSVEAGRNVLGAVFARNSGTENKTATYARGRADCETQLVAIAQKVNHNHGRMMKDERIPEAHAAQALSAALSKKRSLSLAEARRIAEELGVRGEAGFAALLFALARQGEIRRVGDEIQSLSRSPCNRPLGGPSCSGNS